jgi:hypothetical protein
VETTVNPNWPEFAQLENRKIPSKRGDWVVSRFDVLEDQTSSRLALLLDLQRNAERLSIRLLFPAETHAVEHGHSTAWIIDALKRLADRDQLRRDGIYSIGSI